MMLDEAPLTGLFPNRQVRTRGSPGIDHLPIWPCCGTDPFKEIENQGFNGIRHIRASGASREGCRPFLLPEMLKILSSSQTFTPTWWTGRPVGNSTSGMAGLLPECITG